MGIVEGSGTGINVSGIVYERRLFSTRKYVAGVNAGGIFLSEPIEMPMSTKESFENSKVGQAVKEIRARISKKCSSKSTKA